MIIITDEAAAVIKQKTAAKEGAIGLRLNIKETGCSGNKYKMEYVMEADAGDDRFDKNGAVLFVPKTVSWMLAGMTVGFKKDRMGEDFTFDNPNEIGRCGCGESFQVDPSKKLG